MRTDYRLQTLDELRLADVPQGADVNPGQRIDPLIHYAGQVAVSFVGDSPSGTGVSPVRTETHGRDARATTDLAPFVNHAKKTVASSTGELKLDYDKGILTVNAARAQGVSGALKLAGAVDLKDLSVSSDLELGHGWFPVLPTSPEAGFGMTWRVVDRRGRPR